MLRLFLCVPPSGISQYSLVVSTIYSFTHFFFSNYYYKLLEASVFMLLAAAAAAKSSVVSDSVRPHRQQPTRLPHPWDSPGKNTGVGCHLCFLTCPLIHLKVKVKIAQVVSDSLRPHERYSPWNSPG